MKSYEKVYHFEAMSMLCKGCDLLVIDRENMQVKRAVDMTVAELVDALNRSGRSDGAVTIESVAEEENENG